MKSYDEFLKNPLLSVTDKTDKSLHGELDASRRRLEAAGICVAIFEDGSMRIVVSEQETTKSVDDGATAYSPEDMYHYVTLSESERKLLHSFKRRFGGSVEWRQTRG